jgi:hypothetical protein
MSTLNESVTNVRQLLDDCKEQRPTVRQVFGSVKREFQNLFNELSNSSVMWTTKEHAVTLSGQTDYLISGDVGKILFVTGEANTYPYAVDFTDLADASTYWWSEYPFTAARPEDYNFAMYPGKIAFYRRNGNLYLRTPLNFSGEVLTITAATGDWTGSISADESAVMSNYHHLCEIRAALNLAHNARWTDNEESDIRHSQMLGQSLAIQEQRVYEQFRIAKRSLTADDVVFIGTNDGYF